MIRKQCSNIIQLSKEQYRWPKLSIHKTNSIIINQIDYICKDKYIRTKLANINTHYRENMSKQASLLPFTLQLCFSIASSIYFSDYYYVHLESVRYGSRVRMRVFHRYFTGELFSNGTTVVLYINMIKEAFAS